MHVKRNQGSIEVAGMGNTYVSSRWPRCYLRSVAGVWRLVTKGWPHPWRSSLPEERIGIRKEGPLEQQRVDEAGTSTRPPDLGTLVLQVLHCKHSARLLFLYNTSSL